MDIIYVNEANVLRQFVSVNQFSSIFSSLPQAGFLIWLFHMVVLINSVLFSVNFLLFLARH